MRKQVQKKIDGLSSKDKQKLRSAIRKVWSWSTPRKLCIARCTDEHGFTWCEKCGKRCPKISVDHVTPIGELDDGFIRRLFCPSKYLMGLCSKCHRIKTNADNKKLRAQKDFF